jgi:hypothetical protein
VSLSTGKDAWRKCLETNGATSSAYPAGDLSKVFQLSSSSLLISSLLLFFHRAKILDQTATFSIENSKTQASRLWQQSPKVINKHLLMLSEVSSPAISL